MTVLDMLAWAVERALEMGGRVAEWVMDWLPSALCWLGREVVASAADATRVFLRCMLAMFLRHLAILAWMALDASRGRLA